LAEFFYKRNFDPRATTAISLEEVREAALEALRPSDSTCAVETR